MDRAAVLVALLQETGAYLRARSDAEYLYTAAAVAGFGATSWGVAALSGPLAADWWREPRYIAAVGIALVAAAVMLKTYVNHRSYRTARREQAGLAIRLEAEVGEQLFPERLKSGRTGLGFLFSILVVLAAAIGAGWFSICVPS